MKTLYVLGAAMMTIAALPAAAQDTAPPPPVTVSGSVALVSDYRFRGVSQSDKEMAIQGGITVSHESGLYAGVWGSNLAGWGTFGGSNMELDLIGGFKHSFGAATVDVGLTWYMYPGGADLTDFAEPYVKVSGTAGPVNLLAGIAYAPKQKALGNFSNTPQSAGQSEDNFYIWGDASAGIPSTPITVKGMSAIPTAIPAWGRTAPAWRRPANMSIGCLASIMCWGRSRWAPPMSIPTSARRMRLICSRTSRARRMGRRSPAAGLWSR